MTVTGGHGGANGTVQLEINNKLEQLSIRLNGRGEGEVTSLRDFQRSASALARVSIYPDWGYASNALSCYQ